MRNPCDHDEKLRVLSVLSSSNQLYSGFGKAVFETAERMKPWVHYEFAIDDAIPRNVTLLLEFGERHGFPIHVSAARDVPHSLDTLNPEIPRILRESRWDLVECHCWANSATNAAVLDHVGDLPLCYTPHYQPLWTVPMGPESAYVTDAVHRRAMKRADVVLCVSPWERDHLERDCRDAGACRYLGNGCRLSEYETGGLVREPSLLFVGDFAEPRKRFDRVLDLLSRLSSDHPSLRLRIIGNRSIEGRDRIPADLRSRCDVLGYVSESDLKAEYRKSLGLVLFSEYEAYGIPIVEALASGTPAFITPLQPTLSLFKNHRGVHFCPAEDPEATAECVSRVLDRGVEGIRETIEDRETLREFDWDLIAPKKWEYLKSAWFQHHYIDRPFRGPRRSRAFSASA